MQPFALVSLTVELAAFVEPPPLLLDPQAAALTATTAMPNATRRPIIRWSWELTWIGFWRIASIMRYRLDPTVAG
jgi:hypothetical protein